MAWLLGAGAIFGLIYLWALVDFLKEDLLKGIIWMALGIVIVAQAASILMEAMSLGGMK